MDTRTPTPGTPVVTGLSGGVDSALAALLLQRSGHDVAGLFMKNWEEDDRDGHCAAAQDLADAERVAAHLGIPLHRVNFATEYWDRVFSHCLAELRAGRTPNPDVLCNREIKFDAFLEHALGLGAERIATGHYARIERAARGLRLLKGRDPDKDQSYFLYTLGQEQLARSLFPLGDLTKARVRALARAGGLPTADKRDSTGICFIGERPFREFMARFLPASPGEIHTTEGEVVGIHQGALLYTLGQRRGLGIGGRAGRDDAPWFVVDKDVGRNVLVVAQGEDHPRLWSEGVVASAPSWVAGAPPPVPLDCHCKVRYRQSDQPCRIEHATEDGIRVRFARPQKAVAPGQSLVLYDGDACLGGGIIAATSGTGESRAIHVGARA